MTERYAVYAIPGLGDAAPRDIALRSHAEGWLGRSIDDSPISEFHSPHLAREAADSITTEPRRYGFHATLKAPFRLAPGRAVEALNDAVAELAVTARPVTIPALTVDRIGRFLALVPGTPSPALNALASRVVREVDHVRASTTPEEIARRRPETLTLRQRSLLVDFGYPYVLDEFRFHFTLTDGIALDAHDLPRAVLETWFADWLGADVQLDALAVVQEPQPGAPFLLHSIHPLEGLR
jgi:hypothetical protein